MNQVKLANGLVLSAPSGAFQGFRCNEIDDTVIEIKHPEPDDYVLFPQSDEFWKYTEYREKLHKNRFQRTFGKKYFKDVYKYISGGACDLQLIKEFATENNFRFKNPEWLLEDILNKTGMPPCPVYNPRNKDMFRLYILLHRARTFKGLSDEERDFIKRRLTMLDISFTEKSNGITFKSPSLQDLLDNLYGDFLYSLSKSAFKDFVKVLYQVYNQPDSPTEIKIPSVFQFKFAWFILNCISEDFQIVPYFLGDTGLWLSTLEQEDKTLYPTYVYDNGRFFIRVLSKYEQPKRRK